MNHVHTALWGVLPYLVAVVLVAGTAWRYHYDRFGFTTRSSQLHEHRLLSIGAPLFHYGLLFVIGGHVALDPDVPAMARASLPYQLHALLAMTLFALWPFSRLVHAFTPPRGYLTRPYVVYRSRGTQPHSSQRGQ
ncbi:respiratory nitrate reductase subunit gamma [Streptomyces sp. NPDC048550]|uniref:respiratory nitrate reductase subunit gamma n=1 Tax=Streptomyces sp. NPDC048550 TaxID=3155739 RepID=UPI00342CBC20